MILEVTNAIETLKIVGMIVGIVGGVGGPVGALWYMKGQLDSTKERLIALEVAQREDIAKEKEIIKHLGTLAAVSDRLEAYENDLAERRGNDSSIANNLATLAANLNNITNTLKVVEDLQKQVNKNTTEIEVLKRTT